MPNLYLDHITSDVVTLGPGKRIVLWLEGCSLNCPGCITQNLFTRSLRPATSIDEIVGRILQLSPGHQGLTISGGEPFEQAMPLLHFVRRIREESALDIMIYSGYTREELESRGEHERSILSIIDILMDGRFELSHSNKKIWRGSDNQRMHLLSDRSQKYKTFVDYETDEPRQLHVELSDDGRIRIIGIPNRGFEHSFSTSITQRGLRLQRGERL